MTSPKPNVSDGEIDVSRLAEIAVERIVAEITARADLRMGWDCYFADDHAEIKTAFFNPIFKALTAAASSRPAAATGTGWKPIETAPKDGTNILVCWPSGEMKLADGYTDGKYRVTPSYWQPRPLLPGQAAPTPPDSPAQYNDSPSLQNKITNAILNDGALEAPGKFERGEYKGYVGAAWVIAGIAIDHFRKSPDSPAGVVKALRNVHKLISEAAMTGFNCHDGDWADRLFASQQDTHAALAGITRDGGGE